MSPTKSIRRSVSMTPEMRDRLAQLASKHPRDVTEADLIREAIRADLDEQTDLIGSPPALPEVISGSHRPNVNTTHWYRAQQIVETWRASAHRLLANLGESEETRLENRILGLLARIRRAPASAKRIGRCVRRAKRLSMRCVR